MTYLERNDQSWHFDKRIPLAMIGAILIQTGGAFWWASSVNERVGALEVWRQDSKDIAADIAVVKSQVADLRSVLGHIESRLQVSKEK